MYILMIYFSFSFITGCCCNIAILWILDCYIGMGKCILYYGFYWPCLVYCMVPCCLWHTFYTSSNLARRKTVHRGIYWFRHYKVKDGKVVNHKNNSYHPKHLQSEIIPCYNEHLFIIFHSQTSFCCEAKTIKTTHYQWRYNSCPA